MKNLFQNKKILLFTLIFMASCFGILEAGKIGEANASQVQENTNINQNSNFRFLFADSGGVVNNGDPSKKNPSSGGAVRFENPLSTNSFEALVIGIINWILTIVVSLAILFLIIGGLMYIVSAGDEEKIKKAKNIILYAVVGLGVVILSWSIIAELKDILGVN